MYEDFFRERLQKLRVDRKISAKDMSLYLRRDQSYINRIEDGEILPSIKVFFSICKYLKITPMEFFDDSLAAHKQAQEAIENLKKLDEKQLKNINHILKGLIKTESPTSPTTE